MDFIFLYSACFEWDNQILDQAKDGEMQGVMVCKVHGQQVDREALGLDLVREHCLLSPNLSRFSIVGILSV